MLLQNNNTELWGNVYCEAVNTCFKRGLITWAHEDVRGMYYNRIKITQQGQILYENATKNKDRI